MENNESDDAMEIEDSAPDPVRNTRRFTRSSSSSSRHSRSGSRSLNDGYSRSSMNDSVNGGVQSQMLKNRPSGFHSSVIHEMKREGRESQPPQHETNLIPPISHPIDGSPHKP